MDAAGATSGGVHGLTDMRSRHTNESMVNMNNLLRDLGLNTGSRRCFDAVKEDLERAFKRSRSATTS
ncbi:uncharacterized protein V6R79_017598 [Siganus canaliculatus]